jgi:enterochelin esterase-like enzyme
MKPNHALVILPLLLSGCLIGPAPTPPVPDCHQTGTTEIQDAEGAGTIGVYLPPCYDSQAPYLYPVLYLLPGMGGTYKDWFGASLAEMADTLITSRSVPPFIVVTTHHTGDDIAAPFLLEAIIPYVESHYLVRADRLHRAVAGGSLGGASAYYLAFQHPDLFASAGVFGNGLVTGQESAIEAMLAAIPADLKPRLFLNSGEGDVYMYRQAQALIPLLDEYGIEHSEIFGPGGHAGDYWLSNFPAYLPWLAEDWQ